MSFCLKKQKKYKKKEKQPKKKFELVQQVSNLKKQLKEMSVIE